MGTHLPAWTSNIGAAHRTPSRHATSVSAREGRYLPPPPPEPPRLPGSPGPVQDAKPIGTGELATSESHADVEAILRIEGPADAPLRLSARGSPVVAWKLPSDGVHVVRLVAKGRTVEVTMDDALVAQGALRDGAGPIGFEVESKIVTILAFHVRTPR